MFGGNSHQTKEFDISTNGMEEFCKNVIDIKLFAIYTAVNFIAGTVAKCEFKTYQNAKEIKENEYYLWNYEPNVNQTAFRFKHEFITKLLLNNEALIVPVNDSLIIADNFERVENAVSEDFFRGVSKKNFSFNRTWQMHDVLYYKLNNHNIRQIFNIVMGGYDDLIRIALKRYNKTAGEKGILEIDANEITSEDKDVFKKKMQDMYQQKFTPYLNNPTGVMHLFKGYKFEESKASKTTGDIGDLMTILNDSVKKAAVIYKIPPNLLLGDLAEIEDVTNNFITFCVEPLVAVIQEENTRKRYGKNEFINGSYTKIDITNIMHKDLFSLATSADKLISSGIYSIDDIREKLDEPRLNTSYSVKHYITKNYEELKGGEKTEI